MNWDWEKYWSGSCPHGYSSRRACQTCRTETAKGSKPSRGPIYGGGRSVWEDRKSTKEEGR